MVVVARSTDRAINLCYFDYVVNVVNDDIAFIKAGDHFDL